MRRQFQSDTKTLNKLKNLHAKASFQAKGKKHVDVGHTVCPTFNQHLQCGNPAPHS